MRLYWEVALRGYRRYATYRAATFAGVFTNTVFGFLRAYVLVAVFAARDEVAGYDIRDAVTYVFIGQAMLMTIYLWGWYDIALTIRSGDVVTDLQRPFDYQAYWLSQDLGRACYHVVFRGIPPFIIGAMVFELRLPSEAMTWALFAFSVFLAVCVSFSLRFITNLAAFWLLDYRGAGAILAGFWTFLSGFAVPIAFFPGALQSVSNVLPFRAMLQIPLDIFLEKPEGAEVATQLGIQAAWAVAILAAGRLVLGLATRRVVTQGG